MIVCWVISLCNHWNFDRNNIHIYRQREDEFRDYSNPQILHNRIQHELLLQLNSKSCINKYFSEFNNAAKNKRLF
jgi:hypothetical protein